MQQVFSPRQIARAIGASESSVKRWCDQGVLPSIKTAGGHRRVPISGVLEFVREENRGLLNPAELGLPAGVGRKPANIDLAATHFEKSLVSADYANCRCILFDLFLAKQSLAAIFDLVLTKSMHDLGEGWCSGDIEVFEERRGCELVTRLITELRGALPLPRPDAPVAMGGSSESDPYCLPNRMVELVLVESGWNAVSLGNGIPMASLVEAVKQHRPRLFWLSVSSLEDEEDFVNHYADLHDACGSKTALVVGGRGLTATLRERIQYSVYCDNLQRLSSFVRAIHPS